MIDPLEARTLLSVGPLTNGRTFPETPGAVAVDADGDHVVAWTAFDAAMNHDRVFVQLYNADGSQYGSAVAIPVTPGETEDGYSAAADGAFKTDDQRNATVAVDADGDFVVTWTNYDNDNGGNADIYARRFNSVGTPLEAAFRVNTYTASSQQWSNVAMNTQGDFIVTWSSLGQEDNGQMGMGYGVYARRYDFTGKPLAPEFRVNITMAGNQQNSSVAMAHDGGFVVAWQSTQNGSLYNTQYDIIARSFNADGSPQDGPMGQAVSLDGRAVVNGGEIQVNQTLAGNQMYPDVAINLTGTQYVVTWQSSNQDGSGWGVYGRQFKRQTDPYGSMVHLYDGVGGMIDDPALDDQGNTFPIDLSGVSYGIQGLKVHLDIIDPDSTRDLIGWLEGPDGLGGTMTVKLFDGVPEPRGDGTIPAGGNFDNTIFYDAAATKITESDKGAVPPFRGEFIPEESLSAFVNRNVNGIWTLHIYDSDNLDETPYEEDPQSLVKWSLEITESPALGNEFRVSTTAVGDQTYASVDSATDGGFVVAWSGNGNQFGQADSSGVFYQYYTAGGAKVGLETRANPAPTTGKQWIPSVGCDARGNGNVVVVYTDATNVSGTLGKFVRRYQPVNTYTTVDGRVIPDPTPAYDQNDRNSGFKSDVVITDEYLVKGLKVHLNIVDPTPSSLTAWLTSPDGTTVKLFENVPRPLTGQTTTPPGANFTNTTFDDTALVSIIDSDNGAVPPFTGEFRPLEPLSTFLGMDVRGTWTLHIEDLNADGVVTTQTLVDWSLEILQDSIGPIVTDVMREDRTHVLNGDVLQVASTQAMKFIVAFDEDLLTLDGADGFSSILNSQNWALYRNGNEVVGGISEVTPVAFGKNATTRKYEALVTLDGDGLSGAYDTPLAAGSYTLVVRDLISDVAGNALDGEYDARRGTDPQTTSMPGYAFNFGVVVTPQYGAEIRANSFSNEDTTPYEQQLSESMGIGFAREQTHRAVSVDHSGDFAVVWTSYGQDDPSDSQGAGVYMRLFCRDNTPLTLTDTLVNTYTTGHQRNASVAMNASGDFVVVWESQGQDADGSWGIYGQRFDSMGKKVGGEFRVGTEYTNDQFNPAVAMDSYGDFVVVWTTTGQPFSYFNDIHGQIFDPDGQAVGNEFLVNSEDLPGVNLPGQNNAGGSNEVHAAIAMNDNGDFVVTWDQISVQTNGVTTDSNIVARLFDRFGRAKVVSAAGGGGGAAQGSDVEFQVNVSTAGFLSDAQHNPKVAATTIGGNDITRIARNSQVAMDASGSFIVVWESFQDNDLELNAGAESYGVYFRRFNADGTAEMSADHQANLTMTDPRDQVERDAATLLENSVYLRFAGAQVNPSIAMDADGDYSITWNGNGAQPDPLNPTNPVTHSDMDTAGVWIRSFHAKDPMLGVAEYVSTQSRVNQTVAGTQEFSTVAMTPSGDRVVVWSGNGAGDQYGVFFRRYDEPTDTAGPVAAGFFQTDGTRISTDKQIDQELQSLVIVFGEDMLDNATHAGDAVTNPKNYRLLLNGVEVVGAIKSVTYGLNLATNRYEAEVTFAKTLGTGVYTIESLAPTAATGSAAGRSGLRDKAGNPLGRTGFQPNGRDYSRDFVVYTTVAGGGGIGGDVTGIEFLVNQSVDPSQTLGTAYEVGTAKEYTNRSVAVDHDGDFVVVWTSYGQDDPSDANGTGVYMRMYDHNNVPLTPETLVNVTTAGDQKDASVAIDAAGNFVVVWEQSDPNRKPTTNNRDGSGDIYARRFDSVGLALGGEFRVNTIIANDQANPEVAMDDHGNFTVVWATKGQNASYFNDIHGQRFDYAGKLLGVEFPVNQKNVAGTAGAPVGAFEVAPSIAMGPDGAFVVAWDLVVAQQSGVVTDTNVVARLFDAEANPVADEFRADTGVGFAATVDQPDARTARNPQAAIDHHGNFIVVWESFIDPGADATALYDIFYQRFDSTGAALSSGQANQVEVTGQQVNPTVAMDADGDFAIAWNGAGAKPNATDPANKTLWTQSDTEGVFIRFFHAAGDPINVQQRVNFTRNDAQQFPCIAMEPDGDLIAAWSGRGVGDAHGIFARRFDEKTDTAGPTVPYLVAPDGQKIIPDATVRVPLSYLTVVFDEAMLEAGDVDPTSDYFNDIVTNPVNYELLLNGKPLVGIITSVTYGLNATTNQYQAVLVFDYNGSAAGTEPLPAGQYQLIFKNTLRDKGGNPLGSDGINPDGADFIFNFGIVPPSKPQSPIDGNDTPINPVQDNNQDNPMVATDAAGNYVVVWTEQVAAGDTDIVAQRFDRLGVSQGDLIHVNTFTTGAQIEPHVAMEDGGKFIVVWSGPGTEDESGVYARRYDAAGNAMGEQFLVNQYRMNIQNMPSVDMDADGDFVVAWTSYGQDKDKDGIFARRYNSSGQALGNEFQVNTRWKNRQQKPDVALDAVGNFAIVWAGDQQDGSGWGVFGQRYLANGKKNGSEFRVNYNTKDRQIDPAIAMNASGAFVVSWSSFHVTANGFDIYARRYSNAGKVLDKKDVLVNQTTKQWQITSDVGMDSFGNFAVTWTTFDQDNRELGDLIHHDNGVYVRAFQANGLPKVTAPNEFRLNATTLGEQRSPAIAMTPAGNFAAVWVGPDASGTGIYSRIVALNPTVYVTTTAATQSLSQALALLTPTTSAVKTTSLTVPSVMASPASRSVMALSLALQEPPVTAVATAAVAVATPSATSTSSSTGSRALLSEALAAWNAESASALTGALVATVAKSPARATLATVALAVDRLMAAGL